MGFSKNPIFGNDRDPCVELYTLSTIKMSIFASYLLLIRSSLAASASVNFCSSRITDWFSADTSSSCQAKEVFLAEGPRLRTQATSDHMIYHMYIVDILILLKRWSFRSPADCGAGRCRTRHLGGGFSFSTSSEQPAIIRL